METNSLVEEMRMLRSLAVSIVGKDSEGSYSPTFARKALRAARLEPTRKFENAKKFLAEIENS